MELLHLPARFWKNVDKNGPIPPRAPHLGPCWLWLGKPERNGYARCEVRGERAYVHRFTYRALVGPIPEGLEPDHLCFVRHCVKAIADEHGPAHLEPVTHAENMWRARRETCGKGHPLSGGNLRINPKTGQRVCQECNRAGQERFRKRVVDGEKAPPPSWIERGYPDLG